MKHIFLKALEERVLIFDGAMGTSLQTLNLTSQDFGGKDGCNEYLIVTKPEAIRTVHEGFLKAGCDAIETNTFGASRLNLGEYGLSDKVLEINEKATSLARKIADQYSSPSRPRFVIGSIGPGTKLPSLGHIDFDTLKTDTKEQIRGLVNGGADALIIETCQDLLQVKTSVIAALEYFEEHKVRLPLIVQVTFETTGTMLLGTDMSAVITTLEMFPVDVIGMNCATGPVEMADHLRYLCENSVKYISALPNAGLPENIGGHAHYHLKPEELAAAHERFVKEFGVNIIGGCCGTTWQHLKAVADRLQGAKPKQRAPKHEPSCAGLYSAVTYRQDPAPLLIGEQTNANGSKKFRDILERDDYDGIIHIAREAVKEGSHVMDVCVAYVGRDEARDAAEVFSRYNQQVAAPVMIDSTEAPVIETALKRIAGKPIINSVNLEDGETKLGKVCGLAKKYGAGLVALTIDEKGMAKTRDHKFVVAKRIYELATQKYGMLPEDLFFDTLTFTLGSGDEELRGAAVETVEAIRLIKANLPGARTVLGVSNISFGLAPNARQVLTSVFLHEAIEAGLDAAIINPKKILPLFKIEAADLRAAQDLLHNQRTGDKDPLQAFIAHFAAKQPSAGQVPAEKRKAKSVEEALRNRIIEGSKENLEAELDEALKKYPPLEIINQFLLDGMKTVGELFGAGKMQLPFVLQSAEVMKKAVAYLERFMEKKDGQEKGTLVLATVKGDVHDIGKNLVDIILTNNGYKVVNLGIKQPIDTILKAAEEHKADAIGLSGLLVKSTLIMKEDLEEMNQRGISIPVICGGAALTRRYVEEDLTKTYRGKVYYGQDAFSGLKAMEQIENASKEQRAESIEKKETPPHAPCSAPPAPNSMSHAQGSKPQAPGSAPVPKPPFWGYKILKNIRAEQIFPWINKTALFRSQWQFRRQDMKSADYDQFIAGTVEPLFAELTAKCVREKIIEPKVIYGFYPCYSQGNELVVLDEKSSKELARFDFPRQAKEPYRCLSDFFRASDSGELDVIGFQLVTVGPRASEITKKLFESNQYQEYLYLHGLSVESAEALAEYVHALVRRDLGIADGDSKDMQAIFQQGYQGSRYSFGYPACPNLEDQKKFFAVIPGEKIGVSLTEGFQLVPEQSTSAIVVHHPKAKYFNV